MNPQKHVITRKILADKIPDSVAEYAARGLLPLPRHEFLDIWTHLIKSGATPEIRQYAKKSLDELKREELLELLQRQELEPATLDWFAQNHDKDKEIALILVRHRHIPDESLAHLAMHSHSEVLDLILTNQVRMIEAPAIFEALKANPELNAVQKRRLLEFEEEYLIKGAAYKLKKIPEEEEVKIPEIVEEESRSQAQTVLLERRAQPFEETYKETTEPVEEIDQTPEIVELEQETKNEPENLYQKLVTMTVPQKIMVALLGSREARMMLIREPNRLIGEAVVKSPKLTEAEAENIASMRHLDSEVIRLLASRREFMRNRTFVYRLATNPKTPLAIALTYIARLNPMQLREVSQSRDVPAAVRRNAVERLKQMR